MNSRIFTKGDLEVQNIKIGDIHYEFDLGYYIKCEVITLPVCEKREDDNMWTWKAKNLKTGEIINYGVSDKYPQYAPNLYDNEAYKGCKQI